MIRRGPGSQDVAFYTLSSVSDGASMLAEAVACGPASGFVSCAYVQVELGQAMFMGAFSLSQGEAELSGTFHPSEYVEVFARLVPPVGGGASVLVGVGLLSAGFPVSGLAVVLVSLSASTALAYRARRMRADAYEALAAFIRAALLPKDLSTVVLDTSTGRIARPDYIG